MKVLFIAPPLYGLTYPIITLAQAFRTAGARTIVATAGAMATKVAHAGLAAFDAAPDCDADAEYARWEDKRKQAHAGTRPMGFPFFSDLLIDAADALIQDWHPDLIIYPPLGVCARVLGTRHEIPTVMQTVGFAHQAHHVDVVTQALLDARPDLGLQVADLAADRAWIDVAPPSMTVLECPAPQCLPMRYVPYNGGAVVGNLWPRHTQDDAESDAARTPRRVAVSLGTLKPMVDGLGLLATILNGQDEAVADVDYVIQLRHNARAELPERLPDNVRVVDWFPGGVLDDADLFIHHGGAGNTLTALHHGVPQIVFGQGADRPLNARLVADAGCGLIPGEDGLTAQLVAGALDDAQLAEAARRVRAEMAQMPSPAQVVEQLADLTSRQRG